MEAAFKGMGPLEVRLIDDIVGKNSSGIKAKIVEGRGLFPVQGPARVGFLTSIFDITSGGFEPVVSALENFQEPGSVIYRHRIDVGQVSPEQGFDSWVRLGVVLPNILQPPRSGERELVVVLRMVDLDNLPQIVHGYHADDAEGILWQKSLPFTYAFTDVGYEEAAQNRDESGTLAAMIGIAVAMSDGDLQVAEGNAIRNWINRSLEPYSEQRRETLKKAYNEAVRSGYSAATAGTLSLAAITRRLNEIGDKTIKYETVELCYDVMAADGVATAGALKIVRRVAEALELDLDEIENMRDQKLIDLNASIADQAGLEEILGIEPGWEKDRIRKASAR